MNPDFVGRVFPATPGYTVSREKIREFAEAVGETHGACHDPQAARALGYPDVVAPPTFPVLLTRAATRAAMSDPALGLDYRMVVHGSQRFHYVRPVFAGDTLTVTVTIDGIRATERHQIITARCAVDTVAGERVCTALSTLIERNRA